MPSLLSCLFQPIIDACSPFSRIPFNLRLRLVALQPVILLAYSLTNLRYLLSFRRPYNVINVPLPSKQGAIRCIAINPSKSNGRNGSSTVHGAKLKPLHISIHEGAFVGGLAEQVAPFCHQLSEATGCVAVGISHRLAPRYPFPIAHDDVRNVVKWISANAERLWGADGSKITVSGFSAGGNLAFDLAPAEGPIEGLPQVLAWVGFYAPIDLRLKPHEKPRPPNFPLRDPLFFIQPLYDVYAASGRAMSPKPSLRLNPRLRTGPEDLKNLPANILLIIASIDIVVKEQLEFVEDLTKQIDEVSGRGEAGRMPTVDVEIYEKGFHGWTLLPDFVLPKWALESKHAAVDRAIKFLKEVLQQTDVD